MEGNILEGNDGKDLIGRSYQHTILNHNHYDYLLILLQKFEYID